MALDLIEAVVVPQIPDVSAVEAVIIVEQPIVEEEERLQLPDLTETIWAQLRSSVATVAALNIFPQR